MGYLGNQKVLLATKEFGNVGTLTYLGTFCSLEMSAWSSINLSSCLLRKHALHTRENVLSVGF